MAVLLFSDLGIDGKSSYQKGDWAKVAIHNEHEIRGFFGPYKWLSNTFPCTVSYQGLVYPSSENAYKAARVFTEYRAPFTTSSPLEAMSLAETTPRLDIDQWIPLRVQIMREILFSKFTLNPDLAQKLLETKNAHLEERLWWKDIFWGYDVNLRQGENNLGILLMEVRERLKSELALAQFPQKTPITY